MFLFLDMNPILNHDVQSVQSDWLLDPSYFIMLITYILMVYRVDLSIFSFNLFKTIHIKAQYVVYI